MITGCTQPFAGIVINFFSYRIAPNQQGIKTDMPLGQLLFYHVEQHVAANPGKHQLGCYIAEQGFIVVSIFCVRVVNNNGKENNGAAY